MQLDLADATAGEPYLSIRADGTAIFGNPRGDSRLAPSAVERPGDAKLAPLFVVRDKRILGIDSGRLERAQERRRQNVTVTVPCEGQEQVVRSRTLNEVQAHR